MKLQAIGLGFAFGLLSGARAMSGPVLLSSHLASEAPALTVGASGRLAQIFSARPLGAGLRLMALGEIAGDKALFTMPRIQLGPLAARVASGALSGALVAVACGEGVGRPALAGVDGAVPGAFAGYTLRRLAAKHTPIPDPLLGAAEDLLVYGAGLVLLRALPREAEEVS